MMAILGSKFVLRVTRKGLKLDFGVFEVYCRRNNMCVASLQKGPHVAI